MEKPSLLPLLDSLLPLDEAKVAEAAREAGVPLAQAWGVVAYYPAIRAFPREGSWWTTPWPGPEGSPA
jgi:NADH-quinone oxidoreductase subunit F